MKEVKKVFGKTTLLFFIMMLLCGLIYTLVMTGISQLFFKDKANGSIIEVNGVKYGSELLGQQFTDPAHMWGRIMFLDVSTYTDDEGNPLMYAGASNISPAAAEYQVPRIAEAKGISEEEVREVIDKYTKGKFLGILGEETVNVLEVNLALDGILTD